MADRLEVRKWAIQRLAEAEAESGKFAATKEGFVGRLTVLCELVAWSYGLGLTQSLIPRFYPELKGPDVDVMGSELEPAFVIQAMAVTREVIKEMKLLAGPPDGTG